MAFGELQLSPSQAGETELSQESPDPWPRA